MGTEIEVQKTEPQKKALAMENGNYTLDTIGEQLAYAQYLMDNLLVSDTFKKPSQLVIAIQALKDLGLPNSCLKDFFVLNGRPAIYGDTFLGLMHSSGLLEEYSISFIDEEGEVIVRPKKGTVYFGCEILAKRKGHKTASPIHYTMDDKELSKSRNPTWVTFQRDMLFRRCAGRVAKWICPDAIRGLELVDYLEDIQDAKESNQDKALEATRLFTTKEEG